MAAHGLSHQLKLQPSDLVLYSAKVIPGNDTRVMQVRGWLRQGLLVRHVCLFCVLLPGQHGGPMGGKAGRGAGGRSAGINTCVMAHTACILHIHTPPQCTPTPPPPSAGTQMMNAISQQGPEIAMGRDENLHTSGHAYK